MRVHTISRIVVAFSMISPVAVFGGTWRHDTDESQYLLDGTSGSSVFDAVGLLLGKTHLCSGTLISEEQTNSDWVVTAAHCLDRGKADHYTFEVGEESRVGTEKFVHPNWTGKVVDGSDIALLKLGTPFDNATYASRRTSEISFPSEFVSAGFGRGGTGETGATTSAGTKRAGYNWIEARGNHSDFGWSNTILLNDFDRPLSSDATMADPSESTFHLSDIHPSEFNIASGDSGGGMFTLEGEGTPVLAGVTSLGWAWDGNVNSDYGDGGGFTDITMFNQWINDILAGGGSNTDDDGGGGGGPPAGKGKPFSLTGVSAHSVTAAIPEPASGMLFLAALVGLVPVVRRRDSRA